MYKNEANVNTLQKMFTPSLGPFQPQYINKVIRSDNNDAFMRNSPVSNKGQEAPFVYFW